MTTSDNNRELTMLEAVREALVQEMRHDENVFLIGEDIGVYGSAFGVSKGMLDEFGPERVRDTPISEAGIAGACVGAALMGMRPVGEVMFMDFLTLMMDQLVNQAAKIRVMFGGKVSIPMVMRAPFGSGTGAAAQHCQSLESWFISTPGIKVVCPSSPYDAKGLLVESIRDNNPVLFMENKLLYKAKGNVPEDLYTIPIGKGEVKREGKDITLFSYGVTLQRSLEAADILAKEDIDIEVIDPRTLKPLDKELVVQSVSKTGRLLIVHEATKTGGFAGEVTSVVCESEAFDRLDAPIKRLTGLDIPIPYNRTLEKAATPQVEDIVKAARSLAIEGR